MTEPTAIHQLGLFIVKFQALEALLNETVSLIADSDQESIAILTNDLEFNQRLKAADVLFTRFIGLRRGDDKTRTSSFHEVMVELGKLAERRNELVHSQYYQWYDIGGSLGLLRKHSKLQGKAGKRVESEEELQPAAFNADLERLDAALKALEAQRLFAIEVLCPGGTA